LGILRVSEWGLVDRAIILDSTRSHAHYHLYFRLSLLYDLMTSIENLLFSLYVYADRRQHFPEHINIISWEFKRERFEKTLDAINRWDSLRNWSKNIWHGFSAEWEHAVFMPVGDLWGIPQSFAKRDEEREVNLLKKGIDAYYQDQTVGEKIKDRDKYDTRSLAARRYKFYPLPKPLETLKP
jgi:hypothetical protein